MVAPLQGTILGTIVFIQHSMPNNTSALWARLNVRRICSSTSLKLAHLSYRSSARLHRSEREKLESGSKSENESENMDMKVDFQVFFYKL